MSTPHSTVAGVEMVVGACTTTTAKLGVCSLRGGTISIAGVAGNVSVGAWTDLGADNSEHPDEHVCSCATVTITGLTPFTRYAGTMTCDGVTIAFSFLTRPAGADAFSFLMWSCERLSDQSYWDPAPFRSVRAEIERTDIPPVLFTVCHDDPCYADLVDNLIDAASGITTSDNSAGAAKDSELEWDYAVGWLNWMGLVRPAPGTSLQGNKHAADENRLWVRHNCSHLVQWGDNEVMPNHGRDTSGPVQEPRKVPRASPWWPKAVRCYEAFAGPCHPEYLLPDATNCYAWAFTAGGCAFVSMDINHAVLPFNAADAGDTYQWGRTNHGAQGTPSGATTPTRTQCGRGDYPFPLPFCLGYDQCDAIIDFYADNGAPLNVLLTSTGFEWRNEVWHSRWPDEFDYLWARGREWLVDGDFLNGGDAWTAFDAETQLTPAHYSRTYQNVLNITNGDASAAGIGQQITGLTPGATHTFAGIKVAGAGSFRVGAALGGTQIVANTAVAGGTLQPFSTTFVAPANGIVWVGLFTNSELAAQVSQWDKISVTGPGKNPGLLQQDGLNGTTGCLVVLKGDTHNSRVARYTANGSDGLCDALLDDVQVYEINAGTICGSGSHTNAPDTFFGGATMLWQQRMPDGDPPNTNNVSTFALGIVRDGKLSISVHNNYLAGLAGARTPDQGKFWTGVFSPDGGNAPDRAPVRVAS